MKEVPNFEEIDVAVILTEWNEFKNLDFNYSTVFDGRNVLEKSYYTIGKNKRNELFNPSSSKY